MTYFYLGKIPEGYVEYTKFEMPDIETIIYATSDGCLLTISYSSDSSAITYWIKEDCYSVESVYFSNCSGDFYTAQDPSKGNCFIWYGQEHLLSFDYIVHRDMEFCNDVEPM